MKPQRQCSAISVSMAFILMNQNASNDGSTFIRTNESLITRINIDKYTIYISTLFAHKSQPGNRLLARIAVENEIKCE